VVSRNKCNTFYSPTNLLLSMSSLNGSRKDPTEPTKRNKEKITATGASKPITRNDAKKIGGIVPTQHSNEDINNAIDGRRHLEKNLWLCPAGEPITTAALAACLHQISEISGTATGGKLMANAVRAAAFLAEEIEENSINEVVRDAVLSQINELAADMKSLVEDAKMKIDEHAQKIIAQGQTTSPPPQPHSDPAPPMPTRRSYAETLINPPSHADPKLAAKEGIRARQIMLEGIDPKSKISQMDGPQLKTEFNKILAENGLKGKGIRSAIIQRNKGILIEMDNDHALEWIKKQENRLPFCIEVGPDVVFKPRAHTIIAFNAPLTIDLENEAHRKEILEANHIEPDTLAAIRWVKPAQRRTPEQKSAHLFASFTDAKAANRIIASGLTICNKKVRTEKVKREPIRCLKCQGWNHHAYECIATTDRCGSCAEEHRTDQCPYPQKTRCISCESDDHTSWNRRCPTYLRKVGECDSRNPENLLQFFPTSEPWTWTIQTENKNKPQVHDIYRPAHTNTNTHRTTQDDRYRPNRTDSYRPAQPDSYQPTLQQRHDTYRPSQGHQGWGTTRRVDWNTPPNWDNDNLPPSSSWHDETPYDETRLIHKTTTEKPTPGPVTAPSTEPANA
jgi:hypothetical protein